MNCMLPEWASGATWSKQLNKLRLRTFRIRGNTKAGIPDGNSGLWN
jgi:hypothetical protein